MRTRAPVAAAVRRARRGRALTLAASNPDPNPSSNPNPNPDPNQVELTLQDATGKLRGGAPLRLYMTGPPYFLRASCDCEHAAAGEPLP